MALFGVLPPRNSLADLHKIWHGWLRRERHSIPQMTCQSVQGGDPMKGWNVNGLCFFCSFFKAARGQTAGPILTSYISKCMFLGQLHSFRVRTTISQFKGVKIPQNCQKLALIGIFQPKCQNVIMTISPTQ